MENVEFTDDEIREQLATLGYFDVSETRLKQFRKDLQRLVEHDRSSASSSWYTGVTSPSTNSDVSPSGQQQRRQASPLSKPNLSRYQPHLRVSPGERESREPNVSQNPYSSHLGEYASPETELKKLVLEDTPPPEESRRHSPPRQRHGYSEVVSSSYDPTSEFPTTSYSRHRDDTEDVIPQYRRFNRSDDNTDSTPHRSGDSDDVTNSYRRFHTTPETPSMTESSPEPPTSSERKVIRKRKVLRKQQNGESAIFDESLVADGENSYRVHDISVDDMAVNYDRVRLPSTLPPRAQSARPSLKRMTDTESVQDQPLPSYIRPNTSHPHTRNLRKTDPVNRYHQYQDAWKSIKAPGEKSHSALRWEVKAQMMYKDEPQPKPQRVFVPNTYVVPTSKKRSALRWEVRHALERGAPVPSAFTVM